MDLDFSKSREARVELTSGHSVVVRTVDGYDKEAKQTLRQHLTLAHVREFVAECERRGFPEDSRVSVSSGILSDGGSISARRPDEPERRCL